MSHCHGRRRSWFRHIFRRGKKRYRRGTIPIQREPFASPYDEHMVEHVVAFLGNPNVGKSSLFNILTGSHQHVGNWPGKTVEQKVGDFILGGEYFSLVDLPGSYSFIARSEEEEITRDYIVKEKPDLVCAIVDATRLERTMYIALEAMELTKNVAIIINMADLLEKEGMKIDTAKLQEQLGVPVLLVSAVKKDTIMHLKKFLYDALHTKKYSFNPPMLIYSPVIEKMVAKISRQIEEREVLREYPTRWVALKLLERDPKIVKELEKEFDLTELLEKINELKEKKGIDTAVEISRIRYNVLRKIIVSAVKGYSEFKETLSDKIDKVMIHPIWGYPILIGIYALFFGITFYASAPLLDGMDFIISWIANKIEEGLVAINTPEILTSLIVDGVFAGISAVLLFLPIIFIFYTLVAIMEDSGYLARSAYMMDKIMSLFKLQGSSFLSLVMGFGCNVAGIMATRTIKNKTERMAIIITNSFIPCTARIGVISLLVSIFFKPWIATLVMLGLIGVSVLIVLLSSALFTLFFEKEERTGLILELPEYRRPRLKNIYYLTWERAGVFVKKAGTFIFLASLLIWLVINIPFNAPPEKTIVGYLGRGLAFVTYPLMGLDWKMVIPLIFGVAAKETIISGLGIIYASSSGTLMSVLRESWSYAQALSFLLFQTLYMPCFATMATVKAETGKWKLMLVAIFYPLLVALLLSTIFYHILAAIIG